jgi:uncharacterized phage protein (TIGR01671 family)
VRDIKFRAWHEHGKRMVYGPSDDIRSPSWVLTMCSANKIEPMQYTGLIDKDGNEIYEGDIVKSVDEDLKPQIYTIVWSETRACFDMKLGYSARILFPLSHAMEVIGNIYENPDLLSNQ